MPISKKWKERHKSMETRLAVLGDHNSTPTKCSDTKEFHQTQETQKK